MLKRGKYNKRNYKRNYYAVLHLGRIRISSKVLSEKEAILDTFEGASPCTVIFKSPNEKDVKAFVRKQKKDFGVDGKGNQVSFHFPHKRKMHL